MHKYQLILLLALLYPIGAAGQRHGRGDSVQNYMRSLKPANPQLSLYLETGHKWIYFHMTDLRKMKRTTVNIIDPTTKTVKSYEGVSVKELVPNGCSCDTFEVFREFWAFRDKLAIRSAALDLSSELIVADTINGKRIAGDDTFYFVGKTPAGDVTVIKKIAYIRFVKAQ